MSAGWQGLRRVLLRLSLLLLSLFVALVLVEVLLRAVGYSPAVSAPLNGFHVADDDLGWVGIPNRSARFKTLNFDALVETGEDGFRTIVSSVVPHEDASEVWLMGDSTAWGWGVANGGLFADHLQELAGPSVRLRNFGVNAYGTLQELLLLERLLASHKAPAKVVLMVCGNDFDDNLSHRDLKSPCLVPADGGEGFGISNRPVAEKIGGAALSRHSRAIAFLSYGSAVFKQVRKQFNERSGDKGSDTGPRKPVSQPGAASPARVDAPKREAMAYLLGRIDSLCAEHGIVLDVVPFPRAGGRYLRSAESMTLEEICGGLPHTNFVEIETGMVEKPGDYYFGRGDFHWNAVGNRRGAEVYFEKSGPRLGVGG